VFLRGIDIGRIVFVENFGNIVDAGSTRKEERLPRRSTTRSSQ